MVVTPQTNIRLIKSPIELDNKNQLTFATKEAQETYFKSLPYIEANDYTYQRKDGFIRFNLGYDDLLEYNYCMYQNEAYSNKWFYAFITDLKMLNNEVTAVYIKTDVWQSWMFDLEFKNSFIEREHVNDDTFGLNLIPEDLELGEYTCNSHTLDEHYDNVTNDFTYVLSSAVNLHQQDVTTGRYVTATPTKYNGVISGCQYYRFDTPGALQAILENVVNAGQIDVINGIFIAPDFLCPEASATASWPSKEIDTSTSPISYTTTLSKQTSLDTYVPKNNKLLTYPYNYLMVSNNNGASTIYRYEEFSTSNCQFRVEACLTPGCSIRQIPLNYKNMSRFDDYAINLGKFPICSYPVDMYTNWLTQNSINIPLVGKVTGDELNIGTNLISTGLNALASGIMAGAMGTSGDFLTQASGMSSLGNASANIFNSAGMIGNTLIQKKQHELIPSESRGNLNAGDVVTSSGKNTFHFYKMSIKKHFARILDDYFSMYGYQVNALKTPNITGRRYWNYVKTIGVNIIAHIPQQDLLEIKNMFDTGITFWHDSTKFLDYSQNNVII